MEMLKIAAVALTGLMLATLLKSVNKDISIYIILATVIIIFLAMIERLEEMFTFIQIIYEKVPYGKTFFPVILKVLAVSYITDFTAQLCRDAGEGTVASKVEMAGKVMIFCLAIPVLSAILELVGTLI